MSTWSEKVETSSNPFRTYQVNTTVVQPCCKEYFSNAPYIPIVPRNLTLKIKKLDEAGTTAISMAEVNKVCKGVTTNNDRLDVQCESSGLATNSIFSVSFLSKIIDLPVGQINDPSSEKHYSL